MSKVISHNICLRMISTLQASSYNIRNFRRYESNLFMDLEAIKNMKYFWKYFSKVIASLKKALCSFKYLFPFFLFKDWVLETQLRIEFLAPNTGVWNQQHKTLGNNFRPMKVRNYKVKKVYFSFFFISNLEVHLNEHVHFTFIDT